MHVSLKLLTGIAETMHFFRVNHKSQQGGGSRAKTTVGKNGKHIYGSLNTVQDAYTLEHLMVFGSHDIYTLYYILEY